jgi:hypothetical protein
MKLLLGPTIYFIGYLIWEDKGARGVNGKAKFESLRVVWAELMQVERDRIHCFENVTAVLFLVALSGYDQGLIEDDQSNSMSEAIMLFDSIVNSQWFAQTSIILFLNKVDIFQNRILVSNIKDYFPTYSGEATDYHAAREYFKSRFTKLVRSQKAEVYTHFTTAIDTNLIRVVMASVTDIIVSRNLEHIML